MGIDAITGAREGWLMSRDNIAASNTNFHLCFDVRNLSNFHQLFSYPRQIFYSS